MNEEGVEEAGPCGRLRAEEVKITNVNVVFGTIPGLPRDEVYLF